MSIVAIICAMRMVADLAHLEKMAYAEVIRSVRVLNKLIMYSKGLKMELKRPIM
jgi:coenzyme F420-reducing hydrogenase delta subunit